jgi:ABC-type Fe3+-hydroxamate transport system substrate-binding protein
MVVDDEGRPVPLRGPVRRVVSIVPSLTEAVAATARDLLVGVTDWCTHPGDLDVARVRGTKNPDVGKIVALRPDLVLANAEENRLPDLDALREASFAVCRRLSAAGGGCAGRTDRADRGTLLGRSSTYRGSHARP